MQTVIAIVHDPADVNNRCTDWLERAGYRLVRSCPAEGEQIPAIGAETAAAVVFGGKHDVKMKAELPYLIDEMGFIEHVLARELPFLGICLGGQLLAHTLGVDVDRHPEGYAEYGYYDLIPTAEGAALFDPGLKVLQSHWHGWYETPKGATRMAYSENFPEQAFRYGENAYGIQFHPEATRATLERWIGRRPPERHALKGAHRPDRQLADNFDHDATLGQWFDKFLSAWVGPADQMREAAE